MLFSDATQLPEWGGSKEEKAVREHLRNDSWPLRTEVEQNEIPRKTSENEVTASCVIIKNKCLAIIPGVFFSTN